MAKGKLSEIEKIDVTVEEKLKALYMLQGVDSEIDRIRTVRGELPLEVNDLEDVIVGLEERVKKHNDEITELEETISAKKNGMKDSAALIKKYESQQNKVRNNREYDSLTKEIEYQSLDIQLSEKRIKEYKVQIAGKKELIEQCEEELKDRNKILKVKKAELEDIIAETQKDEEALQKKSRQAEAIIETRLLSAYKRIRQNAKNGLAVVIVERDACGGCFNKIPPQRQLDIKLHKKILVCEHCGRILVDPAFEGAQKQKA